MKNAFLILLLTSQTAFSQVQTTHLKKPWSLRVYGVGHDKDKELAQTKAIQECRAKLQKIMDECIRQSGTTQIIDCRIVESKESVEQVKSRGEGFHQCK